jgi:uncharacterized protein
MDIINLVENMSEPTYQRFLSAAETGKWPEGVLVEQAVRATAMHIVMAYQSRVLKSDQNMTIGVDGTIVQKSKRELKQLFQSATPQDVIAQPDVTASIARFSKL